MVGTYQPNNRKKAKKHGFFARKKSNVLKSTQSPLQINHNFNVAFFVRRLYEKNRND